MSSWLKQRTEALDFARRMCEIEQMDIALTTALIVDDDPAIALSAELLLGDIFAQTVSVSNPEAAIEAMHGSRPGVVFLDLNYTRGATDGGEGLTLLAEILAIDPGCVVIVITAHADIAVAVEAIKRGATDFVQKPWVNDRLVATAQAATKLRYARDAALGHRQRIAEVSRVAPGSLPLLGSSRGMRNVFDAIARAAPSDANILVLGENGTGKELVARAIHQQSLRAEALLVTVDVGALGQSLIESELFGHVKGAFTDARLDRIGRFQAANGGTLFLDEIGNLPLHMQPKLLTVLEQRRVTPVGSNRPVAVDVRIVSATNLSHPDLIDDRVMRQDLLFRLNTIEIVIPPLRERSEDIPQLLDHFLSFYARKYNKASRKMPWEIVEMLTNYAWPGNVRELRHLVERAVVMANPHEFRSDDFPIARQSARAEDITGDENDLNLDRAERRLIREALQRNNENISRSALDLGITRHALARKIDKHGL